MIPQGFLQAILESPDDDFPRLALADWLDECANDRVECSICKGTGWTTTRTRTAEMDANEYGLTTSRCPTCSGIGAITNTGYAERAEFIRVQCELVRLGEPPDSLCCDLSESPRHWCAYRSWLAKNPTASPLRHREHELFGAVMHAIDPTFRLVQSLCLDRGEFDRHTNPDTMPVGLLRRGFVSEVRLPLAAFMGCGRCKGRRDWHDALTGDGRCLDCRGTARGEGLARGLFKRHPITKVVLTDVGLEIHIEPPTNEHLWHTYLYRTGGEGAMLFRGGLCRTDVPQAIVNDLARYQTGVENVS